MAAAAMATLARPAREGGSWHIRISLARTGRGLQGLGQIENGFDCQDPAQEDLLDLMEASNSGYGEMTAVRHSAQMSDTPCYWERPSMPLGSHAAIWPN